MPDRTAILDALHRILAPGQVTELRALGVVTPKFRRPHTVSGYFDDMTKLADEACALEQYAKGVYFTPNPVNPALLARAVNRVRIMDDRDPTTSDADIACRRWLLIDIDPVRPAGISASDEEHQAALDKARVIRDTLRRDGWPAPLIGDSGNGAHLLYRIDLPADDDGLVKRCLEALAFWFDDETTTIDRAVFNPARIWKLYGTTAHKGDDTPGRRHRPSKLLE
jgi:hypothetical protein